MKDMLLDEFQDSVSELLTRHKSILDIMTKFQETNARVNRAIAKSVTDCGCLQIEARKQKTPSCTSLKDLSSYLDPHIRGQICEYCKEVIEKELGSNLFYMAAICNALDISLYDTMMEEYKRLKTLGVYNLL
jgi:NTP pyrophosphatase (non-canonical NTP hydrolase)